MIKLIATDLDGTLFYPKLRVQGTPRTNRRFLRRYLDQGGKLLLVSGRNGKIIPKVERQLHHKVSMIGCNGGYYLEDGKIYNPIPMDRDKVLELFATVYRDYGIWLWMLFDDTNKLCTYCKQSSDFIKYGFFIGNRFNNFFAETLIKDDKNFVRHLSEHDTFKLMPVCGLGKDGKAKAEQLAPSIRALFGDYFEVATSHNVLEITAKGVYKGRCLTEYCKNNHIEPDEVIVCGDSGNDLTMFAKFPHSFAMAHSPEHFRSQANHVISHISDLEEYLQHPELMENDQIKEINFEKALEN